MVMSLVAKTEASVFAFSQVWAVWIIAAYNSSAVGLAPVKLGKELRGISNTFGEPEKVEFAPNKSVIEG